jgi:hypothetical protein
MEMEQRGCSEMLAIKLHTPENNPKENIQQLKEFHNSNTASFSITASNSLFGNFNINMHH